MNIFHFIRGERGGGMYMALRCAYRYLIKNSFRNVYYCPTKITEFGVQQASHKTTTTEPGNGVRMKNDAGVFCSREQNYFMLLNDTITILQTTSSSSSSVAPAGLRGELRLWREGPPRTF